MGRIKSNKLRSLNGRLGYLRRQADGTYNFVPKTGRSQWKDLRKWEIKAAIKGTVKR